MPIETIEQDIKIKNILAVKYGRMKHEQVGKILCLAAEIDNVEYEKALEFIQLTHSEEEAEEYMDKLIDQILIA